MERRCEQRIATSLPVMVSGFDTSGRPFTQATRTLDISPSGARLEGVGCLIGPHTQIELEHKGKTCSFHAVWVGAKAGPHFGEIGICLSEPLRKFWKKVFPEYSFDPVASEGES